MFQNAEGSPRCRKFAIVLFVLAGAFALLFCYDLFIRSGNPEFDVIWIRIDALVIALLVFLGMYSRRMAIVPKMERYGEGKLKRAFGNGPMSFHLLLNLILVMTALTALWARLMTESPLQALPDIFVNILLFLAFSAICCTAMWYGFKRIAEMSWEEGAQYVRDTEMSKSE